MNTDMNLAKLSVLLNSAVRMNTSNKGVRSEAYKSAMQTIQNSLSRGKSPVSSQKPPDSPSGPAKPRASHADQVNLIRNFDKKHNQNLSKSFDSKNLKSVKKRMKWNDYLAIQVEKQRKLNEDLAKTLKNDSNKSPIKVITEVKPRVPVRVETGKGKIDIKRFEKDLTAFKPVKIVENFRKLDEQEGFCEDIEKNDEKSEKEPEVPQVIEEVNLSDEEVKDEQEEADKRIQEIIQRYEKTIGKIKDLKKSPTPSILSGKVDKMTEKRSKSAYSNYSTETQKVAIEKLKQLEEEEKRIQEKKEELMRFLDSRSQKKDSSRPVTVSSLWSVNSEKKKEENVAKEPGLNFVAPLKNYQPVLPVINFDRSTRRSSARTKGKAEMMSEVKELLSNL